MQTRRRVFPRATVESLLQGLNPEQLEIVTHHLGAVRCGAVPGAGKTHSLVTRICYLHLKHDVDGNRILAFTFTRKGADEMNERIQRLIPGFLGRVSTLHSLCKYILRNEMEGFTNLEVDEKGRYSSVVKDAIGWKGMKWEHADLSVILQFIGLCKARCALVGSAEAMAIAKELHARAPSGQRNPGLLCEAYSRAEALRKERQLITFDDMLILVWKMFTEDESMRTRWAARWDFVLQDEGQDANLVQRRIANMLARDHGNYQIVGDPAQSIFAFRGSSADSLLEFEQEWKGGKSISMHRNYRCGQKIVAVANKLLDAMDPKTHLGIKITAERELEGAVEVSAFQNADEESAGVVAQMQALHDDGVSWKDMVALYRVNSQSRGLEEQLISARIPYVVIGGTNFYNRMEVKTLLAYLRIAAGRGDFDDVRRCLNAPLRYLGKAFMDRVEQAADRHDDRDGPLNWAHLVQNVAEEQRGLNQNQRINAIEWAELINSMAQDIQRGRATVSEENPYGLDAPKPARLLEDLMTDIQYVKHLTRDEGTETPENSRVSNVRELVRASERFHTVDMLLDYVEETLAKAEQAARDNTQPDRVTLMTGHRSKGLEYRCVWVVGCNEEVLPHGKSDNMDEERRLAFVMFTRAKDRLQISHIGEAAVGNRVKKLSPSRFLVEAGLLSGTEGMMERVEG